MWRDVDAVDDAPDPGDTLHHILCALALEVPLDRTGQDQDAVGDRSLHLIGNLVVAPERAHRVGHDIRIGALYIRIHRK